MGPRKKSTKAAPPIPQPPIVSDYDTDTANLTDATASAVAAPPVRSNNELNLLVLRRYVPHIERIVSIAPFAVVYLFSPESQQWEKCGIEGTLFVCQLQPAQTAGHSRYNVVILNRKNLDNFVTELTSGEDIEITEQYVILQVTGDDGTPSIYGLWIFSDDQEQTDTREMVANSIQECAIRAEQGRAQNGYAPTAAHGLHGTAEEMEEDEAPTPVQPSVTGQQIDLLSLFGKPQLQQGPVPQTQPYDTAPSQVPSQPARFTVTADTDFFRSSASPANATYQQTQQPTQQPTQQNALLDLFKTAKRV